jgi:hydrogenase maturation protein HypF
MFKRLVIRVNGIVQGVGFRPFIYRLALEHHIKGFVLNDTEGVTIEAEGLEENLKNFLEKLQKNFPPLAILQEIKVEEKSPKGYKTFSIKKSKTTSKKNTFIPPDTNLCRDCLRELFDPSDRRYFYPFIVCTHCGPRFSIVKDIPYDRKNTSMAEFKMCEDCLREYEDPLDRRFHTQPTACPRCGPSLFLYDRNQNFISKDTKAILKKTIQFIKEGKILAIKSSGGFHLVCDACNDEVVLKLRERKKRPFKPFALMVADIEKAEEFLFISSAEKKLLLSKERPIVLLKEKKKVVSRFVAPGLTYLGIMLPYTPFHYLLFSMERNMILIMTSGNLSDEPICYKDEDAFLRLKDIADYFIIYNREIISHTDDSVMFVLKETPFFIRRSRGFVPVPIILKKEIKKDIFAAGGDLKNCFAVAKEKFIILSQYLGDLEYYFTQQVYEKVVNHFFKIFDVKPEVFVCDMHPRYFTTRIVNRLADGKKIIKVQHHYAHIVSVMMEHEIFDPVIGIAFDGTGYGTDGNLWGSEILIADRKNFQRKAHFSYFMLPGGEKAIKEVWRIAISLLWQTGLEKEVNLFSEEKLKPVVLQMLEKKINSPLSCSIGRIFDGIAGILGIVKVVSTEAEAPQKLEEKALISNHASEDLEKVPDLISVSILKNQKGEFVFSTEDLVKGVINLMTKGVKISDIAFYLHLAIIRATLKVVEALKEETDIKNVVLSGGAFQNRLLLRGIWEGLEKRGFKVFLPLKVPFNDGGIALGQVGVALSQLSELPV